MFGFETLGSFGCKYLGLNSRLKLGPCVAFNIISAAKRSAIWGQSLPADHFEMALYKKSAIGLPRAVEVCQKRI